MACRRKALTSCYNYLSRRFHPSFLHIVQDDRELSGSPQPLPHSSSPLIQRASYYSRPSFSFRSADRDWRRIGFALPFGIHLSSRNFSSEAKGSNEVSYINDVADVLTDAGVDTGIVTATSSVPAPFPGEVAAAAADSFFPVAALQHLIDAVHSFSGLNWWASIALTTVLIRGATVPLLINQLKATMKLNTMRPEMEKLKEEINNNMNPETLQENQKRMKALFKKHASIDSYKLHGVTPFTPLKGLFIQGPVFISFFMAISNMVEKVPSFKGGGAYWFTDLTTPDAMYIFPVLTALTFLATVELNMQEGLEGNPMANTMKKFSRGIGILTIPFTANFPKAIFCYWVTSNLFSLVYGFVLKRPPVRKYLNLPDATKINPTPSLAPNFFSDGSKPALPMASSVQEKGSEQPKPPERRVSSSTVISQRIRNLEKTVKSRNKTNKKR